MFFIFLIIALLFFCIGVLTTVFVDEYCEDDYNQFKEAIIKQLNQWFNKD